MSVTGHDPLSVVLTTMRDVLGMDDLRADESFFSAGGTSLHAEVFARTASEALGESITFTDVFQHPTPIALAAALSTRVPSPTLDAPVIADLGNWRPVTESQWARLDRVRRTRATGQALTRSLVELVGAGVDLTGALDEAALDAAVAQVVATTPALRTAFDIAADPPRQRSSLDSFGLDRLDARGWDASAIMDAVWQPFDLAAGRLARFVLVERGSGRRQLWIVLEHIVSDAVSWNLVARRIGAEYARRVLRIPSTTAGVATVTTGLDLAAVESASFADAAGVAAEAHWLDAIDDGPLWRAVPLPVTAADDTLADDVLLLRQTPREIGRRVAAAAASRGTTLHALTVFSLVRAVAEVSGIRDVSVYWYTANRTLPGVAEVVGSLAGITMTRVRAVPAGRSAAEVREVTALVAQSMANAFLPIDRIARRERPADRIQPDDRALLVLHVNPEPASEGAPSQPIHLPGVRAQAVPFVGRREPRGYTVDASTRFGAESFGIGIAYRERMLTDHDARSLLDAFADELLAFADESPTDDMKEP